MPASGHSWAQSGSERNNSEDEYTGTGNENPTGNHCNYHSGRVPQTTVFRIRAFGTADDVSQ